MKAVLFDLDGVLVDACNWHYEALNKSLKTVSNTHINWREHLSTFNGLPTRKKLDILYYEGRVNKGAFDSIFKLKQEYTVEIIKERCQRDPSKIELLESLQDKRYKLGCVTNSISLTANLMLELVGVKNLLDIVITNEDCPHNKPHPEPYIKALVLLHCLPQNSYIIEDSPKGIEAANLTGCKVIQVENAKEVNINLINKLT